MKIIIVIPCFNEEKRLNVALFQSAMAADPNLDFCLVDDGSTDKTREILSQLVDGQPDRVTCIEHFTNCGKAEAVRSGILLALKRSPNYVGYWDADLATPLDEIPRFISVLQNNPLVLLVMGARVRMLGWRIRRSTFRHYAGRVFATIASTALGMQVYDTQCGAKLFRVEPRTRSLFDKTFESRWAFDVELLFRLSATLGAEADYDDVIHELPLTQWTDVAGSKVKTVDFFRTIWEVLKLRHRSQVSSKS